ncbi:hypothetical protein [Yinghuangia sp. YIM S09857]|uniref:hypothetical protein n=1 Tax=Yinghuangia sp. YIM S09857 TaxID=3436929 RepID=UPI003F529CF4
MGRHGDRAAEDSAPGGDKKARGVVIPLVAAVLVCLLATSGVWLITAEDGGDARDTTPIGLNVPTDAPRADATDTDGPPAGGKGIQGGQEDPSASASVSPSASKTPAPSKTTKKPATSAPPSSAAPPPPSSAPPPPPPPTSAPPQKEYAVSANAERGRWQTTLTITVQNPNATPRGPWSLTLNDVYRVTVDRPPPTVAFEDGNTVAKCGGMSPSTTIALVLKVYVSSREDTISYTFKDGTTEKTYTVKISEN